VERGGGGGPAVVADVEFLPQRDELCGEVIDKLLRGDALLFGRLLDFLAVLIDAGEVENVLPFQPVVAGEDIGEHFLVGVADVRGAVGVVDGGGDEEGVGHKAARNVWEARVDGNPRRGRRQKARWKGLLGKNSSRRSS